MKFFLLLMFLFIQMSIWAENADILSIKSENDNTEYIELTPIKLRGELKLFFIPKFSYLKGVSSNHYSPVTNEVLDYTDNDDDHHDPDDSGRIIGSNDIIGLEGMFEFEYSFIIPLNFSKNPILDDTNISFNTLFQITPVSFEGGGEINFSPVSFLILSAGISFGTGWNIFDIAGLARNNYDGRIKNKQKKILLEDSFYGVIMQNWFSLALQFDVAEIMENSKFKKWLHIKGELKAEFMSILLLNYHYYDRPYEWKTETTLNGWTFLPTFFLGYSIPVIEDPKYEEMDKKMFIGGFKHVNFTITPGISAELNMNITHFNGSKIADEGWGSDFIAILFGPILAFDLPCNITAMLGVYWTNGMSYTSDTVGNADFFKRKYEDWYVALYSIFISIGWEF